MCMCYAPSVDLCNPGIALCKAWIRHLCSILCPCVCDLKSAIVAKCLELHLTMGELIALLHPWGKVYPFLSLPVTLPPHPPTPPCQKSWMGVSSIWLPSPVCPVKVLLPVLPPLLELLGAVLLCGLGMHYMFVVCLLLPHASPFICTRCILSEVEVWW